MADITINPGINSVDYANGYALINTNQCYFIDVREIDEYQSGFIPPAINFPLSTFSKLLNQSLSTAEPEDVRLKRHRN